MNNETICCGSLNQLRRRPQKSACAGPILRPLIIGDLATPMINGGCLCHLQGERDIQSKTQKTEKSTN
jgi:hypothetical protein